MREEGRCWDLRVVEVGILVSAGSEERCGALCNDMFGLIAQSKESREKEEEMRRRIVN